jgi:hypothetical protein
MVLPMILLTAGCTTDGGERADVPVVSSSPAAPSFPSPAVDSGAQACREVKKIVDDGYQVTIMRLYEVGEKGRQSADREVSLKANLLSVAAALAATRIQAGGDAAEESEALRGAIKELVDACEAGPSI